MVDSQLQCSANVSQRLSPVCGGVVGRAPTEGLAGSCGGIPL